MRETLCASDAGDNAELDLRLNLAASAVTTRLHRKLAAAAKLKARHRRDNYRARAAAFQLETKSPR